jgi:transcriptional regulator with XRE-family HTH domain
MTQNAYAKSVGEWIRTQREALGLSQADVARDIGASQSSLCKWESGDALLSSYSHAKLRGYFKQQKDLRVPGSLVEGAAE